MCQAGGYDVPILLRNFVKLLHLHHIVEVVSAAKVYGGDGVVRFLLSPLSPLVIQRGTSPSGLSTAELMPLSVPLSLSVCFFFFVFV